jgi:synaptobrevin homolog YKT6
VYTHGGGGGQGLSGVMITDHSYPQRVAFQVLNQILDEFIQRYPRNHWSLPASGAPTTSPVTIPVTPFPALKTFMQKYQDPHEADAILKVQRDIDETKVILHKTIESMLARGEKLDNLVDKSERLSAQSKAFYKVAQKTNTCSCAIQ